MTRVFRCHFNDLTHWPYLSLLEAVHKARSMHSCCFPHWIQSSSSAQLNFTTDFKYKLQNLFVWCIVWSFSVQYAEFDWRHYNTAWWVTKTNECMRCFQRLIAAAYPRCSLSSFTSTKKSKTLLIKLRKDSCMLIVTGSKQERVFMSLDKQEHWSERRWRSIQSQTDRRYCE